MQDGADEQAGRQQREGEDDGPAVHRFEAFEAEQFQAVAGQRLGAEAVGLDEVHQAGEEADAHADRGQQQQDAVDRPPDAVVACP